MSPSTTQWSMVRRAGRGVDARAALGHMPHVSAAVLAYISGRGYQATSPKI
jgi:hypothetical protein